MTTPTDDILQKLAPSIVEIISDNEKVKHSTTLGTGFVVTDDGLVVTCRHVIADSQNKLMDSVKVRFHSDSKMDANKFTATPVKEEEGFEDNPSIDIAFLRLDKLPEKGVTSVKLDDKVVSLNQFASIGYKKAEEFTGLSVKGEIRILTYIKNSKGNIISPQVIELYSPNQIEPGMSGAPVLDIERDRVIGIITEHYKEEYNPGLSSNMAFALPVKSMVELYPKLTESNQGLTLLSKFMHAVGEERSSIYKWIEEVYVPPLEYDDIKESLKNTKIVFITGTKEFGKTFTAVRLMYEFFKEEGYQPRWVKARKEQGRPEGSNPQELARIMNEEGYIKPHQIVYFEDPFGKTKYESYGDLENYIGSIINTIKGVQDAYVIITSREEVFKEFEREKIKSVQLSNFEKKMNLKRASYDSEKRKEMLLRWAKVNNCKWLLDSDLRNLVFKAIENQQLLPTPLNIKDFVKASRNVLDGKQLTDLIKQISKETTERFADEILRMEEDEKILFLAFPYLGYGSLDVDFIKKMYENIIIDWTESYRKYYRDFDTVERWFEGDKINISNNKIAFSHPSYYEAFQYAIGSEKDESARIRNVFAKLLSRLAQEDEAAGSVAIAITDNFDKVSSKVREQLLVKLADNDRAARSVAYAITGNFNKLPSNVQQLLFKLADNDEVAGSVAIAITNNFNKLPSNVQQLLFKLADNPEAADMLTDGLSVNFDELPSNVQQLLFKLAYDDRAVWGVADAIANNFNKLPSNVQQLLFKLADNNEVADMLTDGLSVNFDELPSNIREQLLVKLADNDRAARSVAYAISVNFDELPSNIREQLLVKLADKDAAAEPLAFAIANNFNKLPSNVQQLLFKLADKDISRLDVAYAISVNFDELPSNIREQLLLRLADKDSAAEIVSDVIKRYVSNEVPDNIRKEILSKVKEVKKKKHHTRKRLSK